MELLSSFVQQTLHLDLETDDCSHEDRHQGARFSCCHNHSPDRRQALKGQRKEEERVNSEFPFRSSLGASLIIRTHEIVPQHLVSTRSPHRHLQSLLTPLRPLRRQSPLHQPLKPPSPLTLLPLPPKTHNPKHPPRPFRNNNNVNHLDNLEVTHVMPTLNESKIPKSLLEPEGSGPTTNDTKLSMGKDLTMVRGE